jgi:3-hydroxyisobutyrate dehydrogenase-like beta-hydroxyacid dehydrogenase
VTDAMAGLGAEVAASPAELAASVDLLVVCTFSDAQQRQVLLDEGALGALRPGSTLVTHVTGNPAFIEELAAAAPAGVTVLDVPVSGSADQIRAGQLTLLVGGEAEALDRVRPVLASYGNPILPVGPLGSAMRAKIVNNLLFAVHLRVAGEAVELGQALGIDEQELAGALARCSGMSAVILLLSGGRPYHLLREGAGPFLAKDVAVVEDVAAELGLDLGVLGELARPFVDREHHS